MERSHGITGAIGEPRFKGNIPIAGNLALWNSEDLFNNPAGGIGHSGILLCILCDLSSWGVFSNSQFDS